VAVVSSVRDSKFLPVRHTVGRVLPRSCLPVAVFIDNARPSDVAIGSAMVYRGNWEAAVTFAEAMVADPDFAPEAAGDTSSYSLERAGCRTAWN
jgi:hypothetical protein